jgi:superfamily II DNA or RNA helicase
MTTVWQPGKLVHVRGRDWVVMPSDNPDILRIRPLGGADDEATGIYLPLAIDADKPKDARFDPPAVDDLGDITTARTLYNATRLAFRNGAGPFRALAKLSFRPRSYQLVPLIMALKMDTVRLLVADDVGVGKTVESLLILREMMERGTIKRFAVVCLPHLCDQWQEEIRNKLDIEAVVIRSNTQARLDRQIHGDTSVYEYYPYQIISIDYIKADNRRDLFVHQSPDLVIVDEVHTCTRPEGASVGQQQRHHLLSLLADKPAQHLLLLSATPHSGKPGEFQSLLGLLNPRYGNVDLADASDSVRKELARHFVIRKRADVERFLGEDTPFPKRFPEDAETKYLLGPDYGQFFQESLAFARRMVAPDATGTGTVRRAHYWTALGLLRGVMSSPEAGVQMLRARLAGKLQKALAEDSIVDETGENPIADTDERVGDDATPTQVMESGHWSDAQRRRLRELAVKLDNLRGPQKDPKLARLISVLERWLADGVNPVVFCRYIATANYVAEELKNHLAKRNRQLHVECVTSELPDDARKERVAAMEQHTQRVLVATDCLSEGINLQALFSGVVHYDLPWNPNRLEQREGRVDRFGQTEKTVRCTLLFGEDNPIDGTVLDVLLRKVRQIRTDTGVSVAFAEDSQSILDTIAMALLINPDRAISRRYSGQQTLFGYEAFPEAERARASVDRAIQEAQARDALTRSIFAQHAIKAHELEADLKEVDEAIGNPDDVEHFVVAILRRIFGVQIDPARESRAYRILTANIPDTVRALLPARNELLVSFASPTPKGHLYLGRNHRFVEALCQLLTANTLQRTEPRSHHRAARAAVIRTNAVGRKTTILLFRCRNVIERGKGGHQIVAEEMLMWGWRGSDDSREFLPHSEARDLLLTATPSQDLTPQSRSNFLDNEIRRLDGLETDFIAVAEEQSKRLVAAHERFSSLMDKQRYQVVYPVLPMDLLGIYILLPEVRS